MINFQDEIHGGLYNIFSSDYALKPVSGKTAFFYRFNDTITVSLKRADRGKRFDAAALKEEDMKELMNKGIKAIIHDYPGIGKVLDEYGIGCAPCGVGTCLLKDIVAIHNLSPDDEKKLMRSIADIVYPGRNVYIPEPVIRKTLNNQAKYSPPMKKLVDEHLLIKRFISLIPEAVSTLEKDFQAGRQVILDGIDFIKNYADRYHHAKEEDILFKYFDNGLDIIKVILEDHKTAREHIRAALDGMDRIDTRAVSDHLLAYAELLKEHIKKEDEIMYVWMDGNITDQQVGELFSKFNEADGTLKDYPEKYRIFVENAEARCGAALRGYKEVSV